MVDPFADGVQNYFDKVASPESLSIFYKILLYLAP